jgi:hypothetical protein
LRTPEEAKITKTFPPAGDFRLSASWLYWALSRRPSTIEDYLALGYTEAGASWMIEQDASEAEPPPQEEPVWGDLPSFPPVAIGNQATAYEWIMADHEPHAWFGVEGEAPSNAVIRRRLMVFFAQDPALNLLEEIEGGKIPLVRKAYCRNRFGEISLDPTRCVIAKSTMLDFAARIRWKGNKTIAELAAARTKHPDPSSAGQAREHTADLETTLTPIERLAEWIFARHEHGARNIFNKRLAVARNDPETAGVSKKDFLIAFRLVYATEGHPPPATGWPLNSPYNERYGKN